MDVFVLPDFTTFVLVAVAVIIDNEIIVSSFVLSSFILVFIDGFENLSSFFDLNNFKTQKLDLKISIKNKREFKNPRKFEKQKTKLPISGGNFQKMKFITYLILICSF